MAKTIFQIAAIVSVVFLFMAQTQAAKIGIGSSGGSSYTCDSEANKCSCSGFHDCKKMEKDECFSNLACTPGTSDCRCVWKEKKRNPAFGLKKYKLKTPSRRKLLSQ